jgi:hypothetical protein
MVMGGEPVQGKLGARGRKLVRAVRIPWLSGKASAAVLIACFLFTALLVPLILRKNLWIDAEIVVGSWWLIWIIALTGILYQGHRVTDDHAMGQPRSWGLRKFFSGWGSASWTSWDIADAGAATLDAEACAIGCLIIAALPLLIGLIWVLIEVAIPGILFIAYLMVRGQLAHVVNDQHGCEGRLLRSFAWRTLWATIYTAPLALLVGFVYFVSKNAAF